MWKSLIESLSEDCQFDAAAASSAIANAEDILELSFPDQLSGCLAESNGVIIDYDIELLWTVERILETNLAFRRNPAFANLYMPFNSLLFFADSGNGDQFFFPIQNGKIRRDDIFIWDHEEDSRK